ncbi:hypothetical protein AB0K12_09090 [Nonomuraea sp. NPDC049419]|uniref:hypothetical protein n=1 Tax=Nonomuraea sp. NPDC049419 TaxID=3155772 RepID=UPI0034489386
MLVFALMGGGVLTALGITAGDFFGASSGKILALVGVGVVLVMLVCCALLAGVTIRLSRWLLEHFVNSGDKEM